MSRSNGFSIGILSFAGTRSIVRGGHKYVAMRHGSNYTVVMTNGRTTKCDAELYIDDEFMGKFRINPMSTIKINRPSHNHKKFTFVREDSIEAAQGGLLKGSNSNGIVNVKFYPENFSDDVNDMTGTYTRRKSRGFFGDFFSRIFGTSDGSDGLYGSDGSYGSESVLQSNSSQNMSYSSLGRGASTHNIRGMSNDFSSGGTVLRGRSGQRFVDVPDIHDIDDSNVTELTLRLVSDGGLYIGHHDDIFDSPHFITNNTVAPSYPIHRRPSLPSRPLRPPRIEYMDNHYDDIVEPKTPYRPFPR